MFHHLQHGAARRLRVGLLAAVMGPVVLPAAALSTSIDGGARAAPVANRAGTANASARYLATEVRGLAIMTFSNPNVAGGAWHLNFGADGGGNITAGLGAGPKASYSPITWTVTDGNIVVTPANRLVDRSASFEWDPGCQCQVPVTWDAVTDRITLLPDETRGAQAIVIRSLAGVANSSRPDLVPNGTSEADSLGRLVFRADLRGYSALNLPANVVQLPIFDRQVGFGDRFVAESSDRFTFFDSGRGVTEREGLSFGWRVVNSKELEISFSNGDVGRYYRSAPARDPGTFEVSARLQTPEGRKFVISGLENRDDPALNFAPEIVPGRWHAFGVGTEGAADGVVAEFLIELRADGTGDLVNIYNDEHGVMHESRNAVRGWSVRNGIVTQLRTMSRSTFDRNCALSEPDCVIVFRRTWTPSHRVGNRWYMLETIQFVNDVVAENLDDMPVNYRHRMYEFTPLP